MSDLDKHCQEQQRNARCWPKQKKARIRGALTTSTLSRATRLTRGNVDNRRAPAMAMSPGHVVSGNRVGGPPVCRIVASLRSAFRFSPFRETRLLKYISPIFCPTRGVTFASATLTHPSAFVPPIMPLAERQITGSE
jgi:hypothetical protein